VVAAAHIDDQRDAMAMLTAFFNRRGVQPRSKPCIGGAASWGLAAGSGMATTFAPVAFTA
jgi:hypothetical protein